MRQPDYVTALAGLVTSEPLATWKLYLKSRRLDGAAAVLPAAFRDASFQFHDVTIAGLKQQQPRWQDAVQKMTGGLGGTGVLGEAVGQLYVAKYFPPEYRARMQALVANLMKAYSTSIDGLTWMSPETKKEAHLKLSKYNVKIGYPDVWRDYGALAVKPGDALGNADRAAAFEYHRQIVRTGGPVDRTEWGMTPQTINAYYSGSKNEIVFPAAILQPPFFNVAADDAVNYGAIGAVIGHEISHGFDDKGSQLDGDGRLRNWWTDDDRKAFDADHQPPGRAVLGLRAAPGPAPQRQADAGREHRRPVGPADLVQGLEAVAGRQAVADDRRLHRRAALHLRLRAGVARQDARRARAAADRPPTRTRRASSARTARRSTPMRTTTRSTPSRATRCGRRRRIGCACGDMMRG